MVDLSQLEHAISYRFADKRLLSVALTHPSAGPENNQRLEYLGDAVLELCVSEKIYAMHPEMHEGAMTQLRQKLVREERLAQAARQIALGEALMMDRSCEATGGRKNPSVLCDAFEAVLAAVYLDAGFDTAAALVRALWPREQEVPLPVTDNKTALQELVQAKKDLEDLGRKRQQLHISFE